MRFIPEAHKTAAALKKGSHLKRTHKVYETPRFVRPLTLAQKRTGKFKRVSAQSVGRDNKYSIIQYPISGESATKLMEEQNTIVFIVDLKSNKHQIKKAFKDRWGAKVRKVNTLIRPDGRKKAFITLTAENEAVELGSKVGMI